MLAAKVELGEVAPLRERYRQEMGCQIVHDSLSWRHFSDPYLIRVGRRVAGYGMVGRTHYPGTVHEFYVVPEERAAASALFRALVEASGATRIRAQTNDRLLLLTLDDCATDVASDAIVFDDGPPTALAGPGGRPREARADDRPALEAAGLDPDAGWLLEGEDGPVAAGGVLYHYNPPYGDLYMAVRESHRRRGYGAYLVQELRRICHEAGGVPAARYAVANVASRATLQRGGMLPCARILEGTITPAGAR